MSENRSSTALPRPVFLSFNRTRSTLSHVLTMRLVQLPHRRDILHLWCERDPCAVRALQRGRKALNWVSRSAAQTRQGQFIFLSERKRRDATIPGLLHRMETELHPKQTKQLSCVFAAAQIRDRTDRSWHLRSALALRSLCPVRVHY